jgi:Kelch motif
MAGEARRAALVALAAALLFTPGCGTESRAGRPPSAGHPRGGLNGTDIGMILVAERHPLARLPVPLQRTVSAVSGARVVVAGGMNAAGDSVAAVTAIPLDGGKPRALSPLPQAVHDAAAARASTKVTMFGGGQAQGTRAIVRVLPGPPRVIGELRGPLSDAGATTVGGVFYVVGGWDGATLDTNVYRARPGRSPTVAGHLLAGVRYPAVGGLSGKVLVAGGTTANGTATSWIQSFDPASGVTTRVARLPYPMTDAAGAVLNGRLYVIGGLRGGIPMRTILAWAPGERRAARAGRLPRPLSDLSAVATSNAIVVAGGRAATGPVADVLRLRPESGR